MYNLLDNEWKTPEGWWYKKCKRKDSCSNWLMSVTVTTELILNEIEFYFLKWNNKPDNFSMWMFVATSWKKKRDFFT